MDPGWLQQHAARMVSAASAIPVGAAAFFELGRPAPEGFTILGFPVRYSPELQAGEIVLERPDGVRIPVWPAEQVAEVRDVSDTGEPSKRFEVVDQVHEHTSTSVADALAGGEAGRVEPFEPNPEPMPTAAPAPAQTERKRQRRPARSADSDF